MELYLRWLEAHEMESGEEQPLGLLLCTEGGDEQIELLQLDKSGIKVAQYMIQGVAATPNTQRPGGRPPALGESPGGLTAKDYFAK